MLTFTAREDVEVDETAARGGPRAASDPGSGVLVRQMSEADLFTGVLSSELAYP